MITREALRVLHSKLSFIGNTKRVYDDRFAQSGGKIGDTLNVRLPSKYTVRTNATLAVQDHVERSTPLRVSSQYGVDVSFTTAELTMNLDDFSKRIISPAMAQLAAKLEGDALSVAYKAVANNTGTTSTSMSYLQFQQNGQILAENLSPLSDRVALLNPLSKVNFMNDVKALFQDSENIKKQYREGQMGRTGGFDVYENTLIPSHTTGSYSGNALTTGTTIGVTVTTNSWASTTTLNIDGGTSGATLKAGDIVTFGTLADGFVDCHPETKLSYGKLKKFVVVSDATVVTAGTATVTVSPALIHGSGNAYQNCILTGADTDNITMNNVLTSATSVGQSLFFHEDAFAFSSVDLEDVSKYGAWGARDSMDGISMRIARQYAIGTDTVPCRIDVLWGFAPLYPELATRHVNTLS